MKIHDLEFNPYVELTKEEFNLIPKNMYDAQFVHQFPVNIGWTFVRWTKGDIISERDGYDYWIRRFPVTLDNQSGLYRVQFID